MKLDDEVLSCFEIGSQFFFTDSINSLEFHFEGKRLITSQENGEIHVFDCESGIALKTVYTKKYGCYNLRTVCPHHCVLHTSKNVNNDIRYLNLHQNTYLRFFSGHKDVVYDLATSWEDDKFISASFDNTIKLWDLRNPKFTGEMKTLNYPCHILINRDSLIFLTVTRPNIISLYDMRKYHNGPFEEFKVPSSVSSRGVISDLKISPNDKSLIVPFMTPNKCTLIEMDAYNGRILNQFSIMAEVEDYDKYYKNSLAYKQPKGNLTPVSDFSFSADSKYILGILPKSNLDIQVSGWNLQGKNVTELQQKYFQASQNTQDGEKLSKPNRHMSLLRFNPAYMMMATCFNNVLSLWQPNLETLRKMISD